MRSRDIRIKNSKLDILIIPDNINYIEWRVFDDHYEFSMCAGEKLEFDLNEETGWPLIVAIRRYAENKLHHSVGNSVYFYKDLSYCYRVDNIVTLVWSSGAMKELYHTTSEFANTIYMRILKDIGKL